MKKDCAVIGALLLLGVALVIGAPFLPDAFFSFIKSNYDYRYTEIRYFQIIPSFRLAGTLLFVWGAVLLWKKERKKWKGHTLPRLAGNVEVWLRNSYSIEYLGHFNIWRLGAVWKLAICPAARNFSAGQGDLAQEYFVYFKANQRGSAEKGPPIGRVDNFQTSPRFPIYSIICMYLDKGLEWRQWAVEWRNPGMCSAFGTERYQRRWKRIVRLSALFCCWALPL